MEIKSLDGHDKMSFEEMAIVWKRRAENREKWTSVAARE